MVSCDGATQETYAGYRRGGDLELVLENMSSIARAKRRRGSLFPCCWAHNDDHLFVSRADAQSSTLASLQFGVLSPRWFV